MIVKKDDWWYPKNDSFLETDKNFSCYEPLEQSLQHVKKFNNAIDVGAWIGDSTEYLCRYFDNVIAFEPQPICYQALSQNIADKNIINCITYNIGLSNKNGTSTLYNTHTSFQGWITEKTQFKRDTPEKSFSVDIKTLDSYNFKNIDFIKIDVDSHESWLLQGAKTFFTNNNPVICIECKSSKHKDRQPVSMPSIESILDNYGYTLIKKLSRIDYLYIRK